MTLAAAKTAKKYIIKDTQLTGEMKRFLTTLGCYPGEEITIISKLTSNYIVSLKDARYSIDAALANAIIV